MKKIFVAIAFLLILIPWIFGIGEISSAAAAPAEKTPYLIYPGNPTQMQVLWQLPTSRNATLSWGTDHTYTLGKVTCVQLNSTHQFRFTIPSLTPGTLYYYQIVSSDSIRTGSFRAAPPETATDVKFFAYGDTRTNPAQHNLVNQAMVTACKADPIAQTLTIFVGDWVANGNSEASWSGDFFGITQTYTREFQANMPINGVRGNHEGNGGLYRKYWPYPYTSGFYWSFDYGPVHFTMLDQYENYRKGSAQYNWLVNDLSHTTKPWKIIVLHEPGYSAGGEHGDNRAVQTLIQPLCVKYGVRFILAGHNHCYARCIKDGIIHLTLGGGGAPLVTPDPKYSPYVVVSSKNYHYAQFSISENMLQIKIVTPDGTVIDSFDISR